MNTLAIEINDAELTVADGSGVLATEPGYAALVDGKVVTGARACAQARRRPRQTSNRYWEDLSLDPESAGIEGAGSSAELAFSQLDALWKRYGGAGKDAVVIVPGTLHTRATGLAAGAGPGMRNACSGDGQSGRRGGERPALGRGASSCIWTSDCTA